MNTPRFGFGRLASAVARAVSLSVAGVAIGAAALLACAPAQLAPLSSAQAQTDGIFYQLEVVAAGSKSQGVRGTLFDRNGARVGISATGQVIANPAQALAELGSSHGSIQTNLGRFVHVPCVHMWDVCGLLPEAMLADLSGVNNPLIAGPRVFRLHVRDECTSEESWRGELLQAQGGQPVAATPNRRIETAMGRFWWTGDAAGWTPEWLHTASHGSWPCLDRPLNDDIRSGGVGLLNFMPRARAWEPDRVLGGHQVQPGENPWQVALLRSDQWGFVFCGGSVVAPEWVLTAAHCLSPMPSLDRLVIVAGKTDLHALPYEENLTVDKIVFHPRWDFQGPRRGQFRNDVVLLHVVGLERIEAIIRERQRHEPAADQRFPLSVLVGPLGSGGLTTTVRLVDSVEMASEETMGALGADAALRVTGWGELWYNGDQSSDLEEASIPLADFAACRRQYPGGIDDGMICAGYLEGGADACRGDSGGPLTADVNGRRVLIGVVSFGRGCGQARSFGVYARVSRFRDWITACIAAHAVEPTSSASWQAVRCDRLSQPATATQP